MQVHPIFDVNTQTWCVNDFEASTIRELLAKLCRKYKKLVVAKDYFPAGNPSPRIVYPVTDTMRPASPNTIAGPVARYGIRSPSEVGTVGLKRKKNRPDSISEGRGAEDLNEQEQKQVKESVLNLWAEGKTIRQISTTLDLKYNYIGSNILPKARRDNDPRAPIRNEKMYGVRKIKNYADYHNAKSV